MNGPSPRREEAAAQHQPFEELAVGHALSALEPDEQERFLAHLSSCARCERDLDEHRATLAQLAHAAPAVEPPPALLESIRSAVQAEGAPARGSSSAATGTPPAGPPGDQLAARRARRSVQVPRASLLASAAVVAALVLGLGGWVGALQRDSAQQEQRYESLAAAVRALESPEAQTVRLATPEGEVVAVAIVAGQELSLAVEGLAPNDPDTTYVLWGQSQAGDVRAVGAFDVRDAELDVLRDLRLEQGVDDVVALLVTREQGREAPAVTEQPVLVSGTVQQT